MSLDKSLSPTKSILPIPKDEPKPEFKYEPMEQDSNPIAIQNTTSQADAEVNCVQSREDMAAIKIQKVYRGYMVRKGSNPLKAWRKLKMYMISQAVKRQGVSSLMSIQTMARVQSEVRTRKIRMAQVNEQLHQKRLNKLNVAKCSERSGWDLSPKSKEQVEESRRRKMEAIERKEKVLAFTNTRQQTWRKNLQKSASSKWDVVRPWETGTVGVMTKRQSAPSNSKAVAQSQSKVAKTEKAWSPMSKSGPITAVVSGKKRVQNTGAVVGSAKKRWR